MAEREGRHVDLFVGENRSSPLLRRRDVDIDAQIETAERSSSSRSERHFRPPNDHAPGFWVGRYDVDVSQAGSVTDTRFKRSWC